jgi:hypothetical protein
MFNGELVASDTMASVPRAVPFAVGAKVEVKVTLWPGFNVIGRVRPLIAKPAPSMLACETVTADPAVFAKVAEMLVLLPTGMLPNERVAGLAERAPALLFWEFPATP